jgi:aryl-alcohol dehydrogenase-like predicted oxidoreductase
MDEWLHRTPHAFHGKRVFRLGLSASFGVDEAGVRYAMDRGVNLFLHTMRAKGLRTPLKEALAGRREEVAVVAYAHVGWFGWGVRRGAEAALKELGCDYLDVLMLGWLGVGAAWTRATERELVHLRESGKVRAIGTSIHDRLRAGRLAASAPLDLLMIRYNAAHPGAEADVFPHRRGDAPTILAYTATAWRRLLGRPKGWDGPIMTAGDCYRFQLSSPHVDVALTGPRSREEVEQNLTALERGPLTADEERWMRAFGHAVHG